MSSIRVDVAVAGVVDPDVEAADEAVWSRRPTAARAGCGVGTSKGDRAHPSPYCAETIGSERSWGRGRSHEAIGQRADERPVASSEGRGHAVASEVMCQGTLRHWEPYLMVPLIRHGQSVWRRAWMKPIQVRTGTASKGVKLNGTVRWIRDHPLCQLGAEMLVASARSTVAGSTSRLVALTTVGRRRGSPIAQRRGQCGASPA